MRKLVYVSFIIVVLLLSAATIAADKSLVAWWDFSRQTTKTTVEITGGVTDKVEGNFKCIKA